MRALLLAGGLGKRLRPLTDDVPKCLVTVAKKPLLDYWINRLTIANFDYLIINTHYLADQVREFVKRHPLQDKVKLIHEEVLLGTAGTLKENIDFLIGEDCLLAHADNYCDADFEEFVSHHNNRPKECLITMMTFITDTPESCGIVQIDHNGVVKNFYEKETNPRGNLANGAIYILSKEFLSSFKEEFHSAVDFSEDVIPKLLGRIYTYHTSAKLVDIGTLRTYDRLNEELDSLNSS